uniref:Uncharacterized protein n=1 Tax=Nelumbo nucifera TaxID=4432 RepID=A0A822XTD1_NELNU|nr:TPA_asm: hypothetical protein HUJ06_023885 [Nelumbo nucifera]
MESGNSPEETAGVSDKGEARATGRCGNWRRRVAVESTLF